MGLHPLASQKAPASLLVNIPRLTTAYFVQHPQVGNKAQRVAFGTSGHRGSSLEKSFNEDHILAVSQAVCDYRREKNIQGPLFLGMDSHALSEPALATALEVLIGNGVQVMLQKGLGYTPTPVISHAILTYNRDRTTGLADGIVITPSHNPPDSGGFKYNPPHGGPADTDVTKVIEDRANALLQGDGPPQVKRVPYDRALTMAREYDYVTPYVDDLINVVDMEAIAAGGLKIGVDPLGGSSLAFWEPIARRYRLDITVVNQRIDPTFSFMTVDHDGKIRMDCSSPHAMAGLIGLKNQFDIAFGNDADADRHGIVTRSGLMNPNHYLAVAVWYLFQNRPLWPTTAAVGKTLVSSAMIDRVAKHLGRRLCEVPVGFKWFVDGLRQRSFGFGGEESAGASFLRRDGSVWTTDKDGIILGLLAAEITVKMGRDPAQIYRELSEKFGVPAYERMDAVANAAQKKVLANLSASSVQAKSLAGEPILQRITHAPGNNAPIGGLKVTTENGWFAARPSGTEEVYKIYAESFKGTEHLAQIQVEAQAIVNQAFQNAGV